MPSWTTCKSQLVSNWLLLPSIPYEHINLGLVFRLIIEHCKASGDSSQSNLYIRSYRYGILCLNKEHCIIEVYGNLSINKLLILYRRCLIIVVYRIQKCDVCKVYVLGVVTMYNASRVHRTLTRTCQWGLLKRDWWQRYFDITRNNVSHAQNRRIQGYGKSKTCFELIIPYG